MIGSMIMIEWTWKDDMSKQMPKIMIWWWWWIQNGNYENYRVNGTHNGHNRTDNEMERIIAEMVKASNKKWL